MGAGRAGPGRALSVSRPAGPPRRRRRSPRPGPAAAPRLPAQLGSDPARPPCAGTLRSTRATRFFEEWKAIAFGGELQISEEKTQICSKSSLRTGKVRGFGSSVKPLPPFSFTAHLHKRQ